MEIVKVPRRVSLVIEDDGDTKFNFRLDGDIERYDMPNVSPKLYTPAEFWGLELLKTFHEMLQEHGQVKKMNREERRQT